MNQQNKFKLDLYTKKLNVKFMIIKKSTISKIEEKILKITKPKYMNSQIEIEKFINKQMETEDKTVKTVFKTKKYDDNQILTFGDENKDRIILYIHGGGYINEINIQHKSYSYILSKKLNAYVIMPAYPLAPKHTYKETYKLISQIYEKLLKQEKEIILMGDSAGGGFAISFCQYLNTINLKQPDYLITFSPWLDLSMSGEYEKIEKTDPILGITGLKAIGEKWAGDLDTQDYKVSPYYGDNTNLPKTLIFTGTNEIFYTDIKKYYKKLQNEEIDVKLIEGEDLFHIYPLFPNPEAKEALKIIKNEIK